MNKTLSDFDDADIDTQLSLIDSLFESIDDEVAVKLCEIIVDAASDEYLRSRILEVLYSGVEVHGFLERFGDAVQQVLSRVDDDLVRQHAAKASWRHCGNSNMIFTLEGIVADANQDIDVRHNAFTALERNKGLPNVRRAIERLVDTVDFTRYAKEALSQNS